MRLFIHGLMSLLLLLFTVVISTKGISRKFFVYDWPELVDRYANFTDRDHGSHGVEMPMWRFNHGFGRSTDIANNEFKTSQFSLFKIIYERSLIDSKRTLDPLGAVSYLIPYDFGMDATFFESHGRMRRTNCPLSSIVQQRLLNSPQFKKNHGHDHTLIISINQNMNYFMGGPKCIEILRLCWNCTKIAIDEYTFIAHEREFETKHRGINWHAIPFPSDYHLPAQSDLLFPVNNKPQQQEQQQPQLANKLNISFQGLGRHYHHYNTNFQNTRPIIVSFTGNSKRFNEHSTMIREALVKQCAKHGGNNCVHGAYKHDNSNKASAAVAGGVNKGSGVTAAAAGGGGTSHHKLARDSVFCLQPPGDMPTRKSLFDAVLSGCIAVLFHPLTASHMYEWHPIGGLAAWRDIAVHFDTHEENMQLIEQRVDFVAKLLAMHVNESGLIRHKQKRMQEVAFQLQYSNVFGPAVDAMSSSSCSRPNADAALASSYLPTPSSSSAKVTTATSTSIEPSNSSHHHHHHSTRHDLALDAYDITMRHLLDIHSGRQTHNRTTPYVTCMTLSVKNGPDLQTADWCNATDSIVDPFYPPVLISDLYSPS